VSLQPGTWARLTHSPLYLDQTAEALDLEQAEVERFYWPLAAHLLSAQSGKRQLVAVAGPPGCGKTSFATLLVALMNAERAAEIAVLMGLDGWHYANTYLEAHTLCCGPEILTLRQIKGAPQTYDVASAHACLERARSGETVKFPVYSRERHDPLPDRGIIAPHHRIVVVEGNYLLLQEEPWRQFHPLFDLCVLLTAPRPALLEALRQRHLRGGKTVAATEQQIARVDLPNIANVLNNSIRPDVLIHKANSRRIERVEWLTAPSPPSQVQP